LALHSDTSSVNPDVVNVSAPLVSCVLDVLDMHCAACASLIESALNTVDGVSRSRVHYATQRARVTFDPGRTSAIKLVERIEQSGYVADACDSINREDIVRQQRHKHIWGFGLAAFCAMQIMMLTLPRFLAGAEMEPELAPLLDLAALALVLPVVCGVARPFYRGAAREFRLRRPGMDSAITLGIASAVAGSMWHLLSGAGTLYFDSVAMFVALLLGVRWLEWEQRERNQEIIRSIGARHTPVDVMRLDSADASGHSTVIPVSSIAVGDLLLIRTGESIPVDGTLESRVADCDESLLTGESASVRRVHGQLLVAGAVNVGAAIVMRAICDASSGTAQRLMGLVDDSSKPGAVAAPELAARYFMPALALVSTATFLSMLSAGITVAMERAIAVLVISCPCALALAAPAAYARAFAGLLSRGVVLRRTSALASLAKADAFLLDKTGTLSTPHVNKLSALRAGVSATYAMAVMAILERTANHPLAVALRSTDLADIELTASDLQWIPGEGVSGVVSGVAYRFGRDEFAGIHAAVSDEPDAARRLWLTDALGVVCALDISELPREDALPLVNALQNRGFVEILSGDQEEKTRTFANLLKIPVASGAQTPEQKAARVRQLQREGRTVVMIGDGVNDSVGFAGANVAIAVQSATDAARISADIVCATTDLMAIDSAIVFAQRAISVVRSNFVWAITYNLIAIPFAVAGVVNPLVASVGMAVSSLVVMINVMRLSVTNRKPV
jgi:P-type Cu2+ transporter